MRFRSWLVLAFLFLVNAGWAAVTSEVSRTDYTGNGSVAAYATTFPVKATTEVRVFTQDADGEDVELTLGADYSAVLSTAGLCTITLTAGNLTSGYKLSLQRGIPYTQTYNPAQSGAYNAASLGTALDRLSMEVIRLKGDVARSIKIPYLEAGGDSVTKLDDNAATRANQALVFDASGNVMAGASVSVSASAFAQTLLDDTTASEARTTLGLGSLSTLSTLPLTSLASQAARTVVANDTAGAAVPTARSIDDLTVLADGSTTRRDLSARATDIFNVKDWGATGDGTTDDRAAIQACVTAGANASGTIFFPAGDYRVTAAITFPTAPARSFIIQGASATSTGIKDGGTAHRIFDFTGCNGPSVVIRDISLNGNGVSAVATGAYVNTANGITFKNVWFRGLAVGIQKAVAASYISLYDCVFEFNNTAVLYAEAVQCIFSNLLFYRNQYDMGLSGTLYGLVCSNLVIFETQLQSIILTGASGGLFSNIMWRQDFAAYTPDLLVLEGASNNNVFNGLKTQGFGTSLIKFATGSTAADNLFSNFYCSGLSSGVGIILASGCLRNRFDGGIISGCLYGTQEVSTNSEYSRIRFTGCTNAVLVQGAVEPSFHHIRMDGNTNDWVTVAVATAWIDEIDGSLTGLTPTRLGRRAAGVFGRTFYGAAAPVSLTYQLGDRVLNVAPAVGSPKAWVCTVAGTPGTWVSEGNL